MARTGDAARAAPVRICDSAARFSSALGVYDFVKRTSILRYSASELRNTAHLIAALAEAEGLEAHARSALIRLEQGEG